jgi:hypothetical protein
MVLMPVGPSCERLGRRSYKFTLNGLQRIGGVAGRVRADGGDQMEFLASTFAGQLKHFAKSVDIVDDEIFERARRLIYKYVRDELQAGYFEVDIAHETDGETGLEMFWSSLDHKHIWRLQNADGLYVNCITRAFALSQPMWIVASDKTSLGDAGTYTDMWSHSGDLPRHNPSGDGPIRTVVIVPLRMRGRLLGAYYFESSAYIGITEVAKQELLRLADSLAILFELYEAHKSQARMTTESIDELWEVLSAARFPKLAKPHFFVAFSKRADPKVGMVIRECLDRFSDRLEFTDWTQIFDSGNINAQISREITRSRFGICYFSEPSANETAHAFMDNLNVVFEAGMLHALTSVNAGSTDAEPSGWIPMREEDSPPAPFDFAAERTICVPRATNGSLHEERLASMLQTRILKLIGEKIE